MSLKVESIVNGVNFKRFCDVVIDADTINDSRNYRDGDIVFCKTDLLRHLFDEIADFDGKLKLVSHQSDYPIGPMLWEHKPECITKWFAQNVNYQHPDLIPIPIGIENHFGPSKGSLIDIDFIEKTLPIVGNDKIHDKIYCNFKNTHPNRENVRNILGGSNIGVIQTWDLPSRTYHEEMSQYLFVASPRGNGIDCHRTWEALLVGSIPIVERHFMYDNFFQKKQYPLSKNVSINESALAARAAGQAVSACGAGVRPTNVAKRERQPAMKQEAQRATAGIFAACGENKVKYDAYPTLPIIQIDDWREVLEPKFLERKAEEILSQQIDYSPLFMRYWEDYLYK